MTSTNEESISKYHVFNIQINELKQMKTNLETTKNELAEIQTKYYRQLTDYETKLEHLYLQAQKVREELEEKQTNVVNAAAEWNDIKSKLETSVMSSKQRVKLNVGGKYYETTIETLTKYSEETTSYFKALFSKQWQLEKDPKDDSIFIDRDGVLFGYILQYLRTGKLTIDNNDLILRQNLISETKFYDIQGIADILKINDTVPQKKLYLDTKILSYEQQEHLNKLYSKADQQWQLIYRVSFDGHTAEPFHKLCDNRGPTMTVIKSKNGYIFGGFTTIPWTSSPANKSDRSAFLFTLKNPHNIKPTKYPIHEQCVEYATAHKRTSGPTFGCVDNGGSHIHLKSPFNGSGSRIFFPQSYKDTTGKGRNTFTGDSHFTCEDVEVFLLISH